jgi:site-specific DNA-methyltransferase (adenine-specific)
MKPYYDHAGITIYHGDCREILPELPKVDLVLTDPPYGVGFQYSGVFEDSFGEWTHLVACLIDHYKTSADCMMLSTSKIEGEQWIWRYHPPDWRICWYKGACPARCHVGFKDWEPIFVWGKCWSTPFHDYFHAAPIQHARAMKTIHHPCPKPIKWARHLVLKSTAGTILDPFMGSGTTLVAAKELGRKAIGIEIEEKYCEIAVERLRQEVFDFGNDRGE